MAGFWKSLIGLYLPTRYMVANNSSYKIGDKCITGMTFTQEYVWIEDARKEFEAWIVMGNYDSRLYEYDDGKWQLRKSYDCKTKELKEHK